MLHTYLLSDSWHMSAKLMLCLSRRHMPACSKEATNAEHKGGSRKRDKASSIKFLQALASWRSGGIAPPACTSPLSLLSMASILSGALEAMFLGIKKLTSQSFQHKSCENHMRPQQLTQETHDECYVILKLICYLGALTGMLDQNGLTNHVRYLHTSKTLLR